MTTSLPLNLLRTVFITALITIMGLSLMPTAYDPILSVWDKAKHFAAFALLTALFTQAWPNRPGLMTKCLLLLIYGLLVECLQALTPDRHFSLLDLLANATGIATYASVLHIKTRISDKGANRPDKVQVRTPAPDNDSIVDMKTTEQERYNP